MLPVRPAGTSSIDSDASCGDFSAASAIWVSGHMNGHELRPVRPAHLLPSDGMLVLAMHPPDPPATSSPPSSLSLSAKARRTADSPINALIAAKLANPDLVNF